MIVLVLFYLHMYMNYFCMLLFFSQRFSLNVYTGDNLFPNYVESLSALLYHRRTKIILLLSDSPLMK